MGIIIAAVLAALGITHPVSNSGQPVLSPPSYSPPPVYLSWSCQVTDSGQDITVSFVNNNAQAVYVHDDTFTLFDASGNVITSSYIPEGTFQDQAGAIVQELAVPPDGGTTQFTESVSYLEGQYGPQTPVASYQENS